jgi:hypothetical protein
MATDRNNEISGGKSFAQIDAEQAEYVRAANAALAAVQGKSACWSSYSASHTTFEMLIGEPWAEDNVVLSMPACEYVAGPIRWAVQRIEVTFRRDREREDAPREFEFRDEGVGFRAVGAMFRWRRGYDLWAQGGLWFGRGVGPAAPLSCEQAEQKVGRLLRHYYHGRIGYSDLKGEVSLILDQTPVLTHPPGVAE